MTRNPRLPAAPPRGASRSVMARVMALVLSLFTVFAGALLVAPAANADDLVISMGGSVTICHRDSNVKKPYGPKPESVSFNSTNDWDSFANGHADHTGLVFPNPDWGDIIPAFTVMNGSTLVGHFDGLNWDTGQDIYKNGCQAPTPDLSITKLTNGSDGPIVLVGDPVTWTYEVRNTGSATLTNVLVTDDHEGAICNIPSLITGEGWGCSVSKTATAGAYDNVGTATTTYAGNTVSATDGSSYFGASPALTIVKKTNGKVSGLSIMQGEAVTWTYTVKNTGNVGLTDIAVTDAPEGAICTIPTLAVGAEHTCTESGTAKVGDYTNTGTASTTFMDRPVSSSASSEYAGQRTPNPALTVDKLTNGSDGPSIPVGQTVTWSYKVANEGNVALTDIVVKDDKEGVICTIASLAVGADSTCTKDGTAVAGAYANKGTASTSYGEETIEVSDPSNYTGTTTPPPPPPPGTPDTYSASGTYCSPDGAVKAYSATGFTQQGANDALAAQVAGLAAPVNGACGPVETVVAPLPATVEPPAEIVPLPATVEEEVPTVVPKPATVTPPKAARAGEGGSAPTAPAAAWLLVLLGGTGALASASRLVWMKK